MKKSFTKTIVIISILLFAVLTLIHFTESTSNIIKKDTYLAQNALNVQIETDLMKHSSMGTTGYFYALCNKPIASYSWKIQGNCIIYTPLNEFKIYITDMFTPITISVTVTATDGEKTTFSNKYYPL